MSEPALINIMREFENANRAEMEYVKIEQAKHGIQLKSIADKGDSIEAKLDKFIFAAERKFAPKWAADVLKWGGGVVGTALILATLAQVIITQ